MATSMIAPPTTSETAQVSNPAADQPPPPGTPNHTTPPPVESNTHSGKSEFLAPRTEFLLEWSLKILGVASAILFGIWAPISYKVTSDGNASNDASQGALSSQLGALSAQASSSQGIFSRQLDAMSSQASIASIIQSQALEMQFSASIVLSSVESRISAIGELRAFEFCDGRAGQITACALLTSALGINGVVSNFIPISVPPGSSTMVPPSSNTPEPSSSPGSPSPTTSLPTASSSQLPPTTSNGASAGRGGKIGTAAALGITFGVIVFVGFVALLFLWTMRARRGMNRREE